MWKETRSDLVANGPRRGTGEGAWVKLRIVRTGNQYAFFENGKPFDRGIDQNKRPGDFRDLGDTISFWLLPSTDGPSKFEMRYIRLKRL